MSRFRNTYTKMGKPMTPADMQDDLAEKAEYRQGVYYWKESGNVVPDDYIFWATGNEQEADRQSEAREIQIRKFLQTYDDTPDEEELFEMRAAFGEGTEVVNVLTGRKTQL